MKSSTSYLFVVLLASALTVCGRVASDQLRSTWSDAIIEQSASRLIELPATLGKWHLSETSDIDDVSKTLLECKASHNAIYADSESGKKVRVAIVLGPTGPISVHSPEICYRTRIGDHKSTRLRTSVNDSQFWQLTITPKDSQFVTRVYYAWNDGKGWSAPWSSRVAYIGRPLLYKLQVAAAIPLGDKEENNDLCRDFLEQFLPAIQDHIYQDE